MRSGLGHWRSAIVGDLASIPQETRGAMWQGRVRTLPSRGVPGLSPGGSHIRWGSAIPSPVMQRATMLRQIALRFHVQCWGAWASAPRLAFPAKAARGGAGFEQSWLFAALPITEVMTVSMYGRALASQYLGTEVSGRRTDTLARALFACAHSPCLCHALACGSLSLLRRVDIDHLRRIERNGP